MDDLLHSLGTSGAGPTTRPRANSEDTAQQGAAFGMAFQAVSAEDRQRPASDLAETPLQATPSDDAPAPSTDAALPLGEEPLVRSTLPQSNPCEGGELVSVPQVGSQTLPAQTQAMQTATANPPGMAHGPAGFLLSGQGGALDQPLTLAGRGDLPSAVPLQSLLPVSNRVQTARADQPTPQVLSTARGASLQTLVHSAPQLPGPIDAGEPSFIPPQTGMTLGASLVRNPTSATPLSAVFAQGTPIPVPADASDPNPQVPAGPTQPSMTPRTGMTLGAELHKGSPTAASMEGEISHRAVPGSIAGTMRAQSSTSANHPVLTSQSGLVPEDRTANSGPTSASMPAPLPTLTAVLKASAAISQTQSATSPAHLPLSGGNATGIDPSRLTMGSGAQQGIPTVTGVPETGHLISEAPLTSTPKPERDARIGPRTADSPPLRSGGWTLPLTEAATPSTVAAVTFTSQPALMTAMEGVVMSAEGIEFGLQTSALSSTPLVGSTAAPMPLAPSANAHAMAQQIANVLAEPGREPGGLVELALDPPELGRLRMQMVDIAGVLTLTIQAERPETAELMRRHLDLLAQEFAEAGLAAPNVLISQERAGEDRQGAREDQREDRAHQTLSDDPSSALPSPQRTAQGALDLRL